MRKTIGSRLALVLSIPALLLAAETAPQRPRNIVLIGWDGAQRNHVRECLERGELPTLKALAAEGAMVDIEVVGTTDTKAGWTEILTGYGPQITGVYSNRRYQAVPKGLSLFERLEGHFGPDNFVTVAVIGKKVHCGEINPPKKSRLDEEAKEADEPPAAKGKGKGKRQGGAAKAGKAPPGEIVEENGVKYRVFGGSPYYHMHFALDVWDFGLILDTKVGTRTPELLEKYKDKPFFFFVHFAEVDIKGHKFGENSKEYNDQLISNDSWTGKIIEKLKALNLYDKTLVYVTADHGFDEGLKSHKKAPHVFLATNDKGVVRGGTRADVPATILDRFGLDLAKLEPPLTGRPLTRPNP